MNVHEIGTKLVFGLCLVGTLALGYGLARVRADGAPTMQPFWYSGTVANAAGEPLQGNHKVTVRLFASAEPTAEALCVMGPKDVGFAKGRFRVDVSQCEGRAETAAVVAQRADLYVELTIDDDNKPFERAKVGAVPYALEARHATTASQAASAAGELKARLDELAARSEIPQVTGWAEFKPEVVTEALSNPDQSPRQSAKFDGSGYWRRVGDSIEVIATSRVGPSSTSTERLRWLLPNEHKLRYVRKGEWYVTGTGEVAGGGEQTIRQCSVFVGTAYDAEGLGVTVECAELGELNRNEVGAGLRNFVALKFTVPVQGYAVSGP